MFNPVFFLVGSCQFMFFYNTALIIVYPGADHEPGLNYGSHLLPVNVITFFLILQKKPMPDKLLQILPSFEVNSLGIRIQIKGKIDLGTGDMKKAEPVPLSHFPGLGCIHDVIRKCRHLFSNVTGRAKRPEWFDYCHDYL
jgi:hypothetical protein